MENSDANKNDNNVQCPFNIKMGLKRTLDSSEDSTSDELTYETRDNHNEYQDVPTCSYYPPSTSFAKINLNRSSNHFGAESFNTLNPRYYLPNSEDTSTESTNSNEKSESESPVEGYNYFDETKNATDSSSSDEFYNFQCIRQNRPIGCFNLQQRRSKITSNVPIDIRVSNQFTNRRPIQYGLNRYYYPKIPYIFNRGNRISGGYIHAGPYRAYGLYGTRGPNAFYISRRESNWFGTNGSLNCGYRPYVPYERHCFQRWFGSNVSPQSQSVSSSQSPGPKHPQNISSNGPSLRQRQATHTESNTANFQQVRSTAQPEQVKRDIVNHETTRQKIQSEHEAPIFENNESDNSNEEEETIPNENVPRNNIHPYRGRDASFENVDHPSGSRRYHRNLIPTPRYIPGAVSNMGRFPHPGYTMPFQYSFFGTNVSQSISPSVSFYQMHPAFVHNFLTFWNQSTSFWNSRHN